MSGEEAPGAQRRGPPLSPMEGERGEAGVGGAGPGHTGDSGAGGIGAPLLRALRAGLGRSIHRVRGAFVCASWEPRFRGACSSRQTLRAGLLVQLPAQGPGFPAPGVQPLLAAETCPGAFGVQPRGVQAWSSGDPADHSPPRNLLPGWGWGGDGRDSVAWWSVVSHTPLGHSGLCSYRLLDLICWTWALVLELSPHPVPALARWVQQPQYLQPLPHLQGRCLQRGGR